MSTLAFGARVSEITLGAARKHCESGALFDAREAAGRQVILLAAGMVMRTCQRALRLSPVHATLGPCPVQVNCIPVPSVSWWRKVGQRTPCWLQLQVVPLLRSGSPELDRGILCGACRCCSASYVLPPTS